MRLLAIDPGIRGCGKAVFEDGVLFDGRYVVNPCKTGNRAAEAAEMAWMVGDCNVDEIAVEWPQVYATSIRLGRSKGDPNDLLALAAVDAAIAALWGDRTVSYLPREWKGQLPKNVCHARIRSRLSKEELTIFDKCGKLAKSKAHNFYDAVGIGLFHLGRFGKARAT